MSWLCYYFSNFVKIEINVESHNDYNSPPTEDVLIDELNKISS